MFKEEWENYVSRPEVNMKIFYRKALLNFVDCVDLKVAIESGFTDF